MLFGEEYFFIVSRLLYSIFLTLCLLGKNTAIYASYVNVSGYDIIASGSVSAGHFEFGETGTGIFIADNIGVGMYVIIVNNNNDPIKLNLIMLNNFN